MHETRPRRFMFTPGPPEGGPYRRLNAPLLRLVAIDQFVRGAVGQLDLVHVAVKRSVARFHRFDGDLLSDSFREIGTRETDALVPGRRIALECPLLDFAARILRLDREDDVRVDPV